MLKAAFYLFLIYVVYKIYRMIKNGAIVYKTYHYHDNRNYNETPEGEVRIKENPATKNVAGSSSTKGGDYVDFEEIKD